MLHFGRLAYFLPPSPNLSLEFQRQVYKTDCYLEWNYRFCLPSPGLQIADFFFFSSGLLSSFSLFVCFCSLPAFTPLEPLCFCVLKSHWAVPALPACGICTSKTSVSSCTWDKPSMTRYTHQRLLLVVHERGYHLRVVCLCVRYITYYLCKNEAA